MLYAEVAVQTEAPYRHPFTYSVPLGLSIQPGVGVLVPFGRRTLQGVVLSTSATKSFEGEVRSLLTVATEFPLVPPHLIDLARWLSERYIAPLYACLSLMLPPGVERRTRLKLIATDTPSGSESELALLEALREDPYADLARLARRLALPRVGSVVNQLVRRGALTREYVLDPPTIAPRIERRLRLLQPASPSDDGVGVLIQRLRNAGGSLPVSPLRREGRQINAAVGRMLAAGFAEEIDVRVDRDPLAGREYPPQRSTELTAAQADAVRYVLGNRRSSESGDAMVTLLHGVTGSGKTEVYLAATSETLAESRRAIVLVPEIALTPQTIERFAQRFPGQVAVQHSELTPGQRYDQWCGIRDGRFGVVIGSRSALFSPVEALGLIIIDEEHEWTYKQEDQQPRYQTRDAAERLAELTGARLVLGSATPDTVSYYRAATGRYSLLELPERVRPLPQGGGKVEPLPHVEVVDLARELREGNRTIFSRVLSDAIEEALVRREQVILFLNRRGTASFILCRDCGHVPQCARCDVSFTFHAANQRLICHQCGRTRRAPDNCPRCHGNRIRRLGLGTERVEEEVRRRFPLARVLRWDRDTAKNARDHQSLFDAARRGEADILIGTQMIVKGLDLPGVTVVGIVNADISLNLPEYYSGERAFQLLTQVAGRPGRRERPGKVILQTYSPNHYAVRAASMHDYKGFFDREIAYRKRANYPPFARLTRLVYAHSDAVRAETETRRLAFSLRHTIAEGTAVGSTVLGPVPCRVQRLRGRWRWQVLIRSPRPQLLLRDVQLGLGWSIDIDPEAFS